MDKPIVTHTKTYTRTGGFICGTRVILENGSVIRFASRLPKKEAIKQARQHGSR